MFGPTPLRDTGLVAAFELREMLRSRKALAILALYLLAAAFTAFVFVSIMERINEAAKNPAALVTNARGEQRVAGPGGRRGMPVFAPSPAEKPSQSILNDRRSIFNRVIFSAVGDPDAREFLERQPPIVLFYALTSFLFIPLLIIITSAETVAQEHQSRGVRFVAMRTGRAEFALGKALGQAALLALVVLLAGLMCLTVAAWKLADFSWPAALKSLLVFWPRVTAYGLPFLGLAMLCSMNTASAMMARATGLVGLAVLFVSHQLVGNFALTWAGPLLGFLDFLAPYSHWPELLRPSFDAVGPQMLLLAGLALGYVCLGLVFYRRRDL
jgi:ABC-type transport system involved in multi-copper enzyme maturation permease subunit